jgi:hypothetical protein
MRNQAESYSPFIETSDGEILNIETDLIPNFEAEKEDLVQKN